MWQKIHQWLLECDFHRQVPNPQQWTTGHSRQAPINIEKRVVWPRLWPCHKAAFCLLLISLPSPSRHPDSHCPSPISRYRPSSPLLPHSTLLRISALDGVTNRATQLQPITDVLCWGRCNHVIIWNIFNQIVQCTRQFVIWSEGYKRWPYKREMISTISRPTVAKSNLWKTQR